MCWLPVRKYTIRQFECKVKAKIEANTERIATSKQNCNKVLHFR